MGGLRDSLPWTRAETSYFNRRRLLARLGAERRQALLSLLCADNEGLRSMMAVDIATEPTFTAGIPRELFKNKYAATMPVRDYDITPDGHRFLMVQGAGQSAEAVTQINVVLNWFEELKRLVPTN